MHPMRYQDTRWQLAYGANHDISGSALIELQRSLQRFMPYVLEAVPAEAAVRSRHLCIIGCPQDNPLLRELIAGKFMAEPEKKNGFTIAAGASPWTPECRLIAITGYDLPGLLHGVHYFNAHVLPAHVGTLRREDSLAALNRIRDFQYAEAPCIENRGIWSWGYAIYDYRKFINNMARLRLNTLVLWHDTPPLNSEDIIAYAHKQGLRIIYGFAWGWGQDGVELTRRQDRRKIGQDVVRRYQRDYEHLNLDGIYFQTLTEHGNTTQGKRSTAALACELANDVAKELLKIKPSLRLEFGLHASSIAENYPEMRALHPQIVPVWEDAGSIPFAYSIDETPDGDIHSRSKLAGVTTPEATIAYSRKLAALRGADQEFALVPKGLSSIDWINEFEHHGPYVMGERGSDELRRRFEQRSPHWDRVNRSWLSRYHEIANYYRSLRQHHPGPMTVAGLLEDGLFEWEIQPAAALFAEMLWNPHLADNEVIARALSPYYKRS